MECNVMYVCMHACMDRWMYVCTYVCIYIYITICLGQFATFAGSQTTHHYHRGLPVAYRKLTIGDAPSQDAGEVTFFTQPIFQIDTTGVLTTPNQCHWSSLIILYYFETTWWLWKSSSPLRHRLTCPLAKGDSTGLRQGKHTVSASNRCVPNGAYTPKWQFHDDQLANHLTGGPHHSSKFVINLSSNKCRSAMAAMAQIKK